MFSGFPKESREQLSELVTSSGGTVLTGLSPPQLASPEALAAAVAATIAAMHPAAAAAARDVQGLGAREAGAGAAKAEVVGAPRRVSRGELGGLVHWLGREGVGRCVGGPPEHMHWSGTKQFCLTHGLCLTPYSAFTQRHVLASEVCMVW